MSPSSPPNPSQAMSMGSNDNLILLEKTLQQKMEPFIQAVNLSLKNLLQEERHPIRHEPYIETTHEAPYLNPLWQALEHACLLGGKRLRPALFLEAYQSLRAGGKALTAGKPADPLWQKVLPMAVAIELVHAQSLVLDDLPCMDNDELRRGYPTVHKAFGEATAVLTADALLALAFQQSSRVLFKSLERPAMASLCLELTAQLADVAALQGLVNGQAADMSLDATSAQQQDTLYIYRNKTAALLRFALRAAGMLAQASEETVKTLDEFGLKLGLLFQLVDDRLDIEGSAEALGKTPGKDIAQNKPTYPAVCGVTESFILQETLLKSLNACLLQLEQVMCVEGLQLILRYCLQRQH